MPTLRDPAALDDLLRHRPLSTDEVRRLEGMLGRLQSRADVMLAAAAALPKADRRRGGRAPLAMG